MPLEDTSHWYSGIEDIDERITSLSNTQREADRYVEETAALVCKLDDLEECPMDTIETMRYLELMAEGISADKITCLRDLAGRIQAHARKILSN